MQRISCLQGLICVSLRDVLRDDFYYPVLFATHFARAPRSKQREPESTQTSSWRCSGIDGGLGCLFSGGFFSYVSPFIRSLLRRCEQLEKGAFTLLERSRRQSHL